jgi:endonuclease III
MKPLTKKAQDKKSSERYDKRHTFQVAADRHTDRVVPRWTITDQIYDDIVEQMLEKAAKKVKKKVKK